MAIKRSEAVSSSSYVGLDEARELERGRADGADRLVVVHPDRAEQADGAERARAAARRSRRRARRSCRAGWSSPTRTNGRRDVERVASSARAPRRASRAPRAAAGTPRARPRARRRGATPHRRRRATAPQASLSSRNAGRSASRKARSRGGEAGILDPLPQQVCAEPDAGEPLVQILVRPGGEAGVDRRVEGDELLGDAAGGRDRHDHHDRRLQQQHLDVAHGRRLERRRRDEREQARHLAQHLGRRLERRLDLASHRRQVEREARRPRLLPFEQLARRRSGSPRSVGIRPAEVCGCVSRPSASSSASSLRTVEAETGSRDRSTSGLRADGLARRDVLLDDPPEDVSLALADLGSFAGNSSCRPSAARP